MGRRGFRFACEVGWKDEEEKPLFPIAFSAVVEPGSLSNWMSDWVFDSLTEEEEGMLLDVGLEFKPSAGGRKRVGAIAVAESLEASNK